MQMVGMRRGPSRPRRCRRHTGRLELIAHAARLAAATTVVIASRTGLPVSTTHILVGSVLGVGLARGIGALDLRVIGNIVISWIVTLPAGGILAAVFFFTFKGVFG